MVKKQQFKNLDKGSSDLVVGLELLDLPPNTKSFNPLTDNKDAKSKKNVTQPARIKPKEIIEKLKESRREEETPDTEKEINKTEPKKEVKHRRVSSKRKVLHSIPIPEKDEFQSYSSIYSKSQLDELRRKVYLRKADSDPNYSIKDALYEAFEMFLEKRKECSDFPDDFGTYTNKISVKQISQLKSFVYTVKAEGEPKYALKYALFEAIQMYLDSNSN